MLLDYLSGISITKNISHHCGLTARLLWNQNTARYAQAPDLQLCVLKATFFTVAQTRARKSNQGICYRMDKRGKRFRWEWQITIKEKRNNKKRNKWCSLCAFSLFLNALHEQENDKGYCLGVLQLEGLKIGEIW